MHHHSAKETIKEVTPFWNKARIPTRAEQHLIKKLKNLVEKYQNVKINKKRETVTQRKKEAEFKAVLDKLFDIAHAEALEMIEIDDDREFLLDQREDRLKIMGGIDKILTKTEKKCHANRRTSHERKE